MKVILREREVFEGEALGERAQCMEENVRKFSPDCTSFADLKGDNRSEF